MIRMYNSWYSQIDPIAKWSDSQWSDSQFDPDVEAKYYKHLEDAA